MTIQEAIERLEYIKANATHQKDAGVSQYWKQEIDETIEVIDMSIEALKEADRKTEPQTDLLVTEYPQDGEVNLIGRDKTEAVVMAYDTYKELTEPQTDTHDIRTETHECVKDTHDRLETMSCQECKWWFTDSLKHGGYCQSLLYNHECRYEPEVDCSWK